MQGQEVVALGGAEQSLVVGHPPAELSQFGRDLEESLNNRRWMMSIQALSDGVELPDDGFPAQASGT